MSLHTLIELLVSLGLVKASQAEVADRYAEELTCKVERGEMTLDEAGQLAAALAHRHKAENEAERAKRGGP